MNTTCYIFMIFSLSGQNFPSFFLSFKITARLPHNLRIFPPLRCGYIPPPLRAQADPVPVLVVVPEPPPSPAYDSPQVDDLSDVSGLDRSGHTVRPMAVVVAHGGV